MTASGGGIGDRTVIVTGAARGLGAAAVALFARQGWNVVAMVRQGAPELAATVADLDRLLVVEGDVAAAGDCDRVVATGLDRFGAVHALINNAAIRGAPPSRLIEEMPDELWAQVLSVNLSGAFHMAKRVLPGMKAQRDGVILNVASINGKIGMRGAGAYNVSKAGMLHLSRTIAVEGADFNVRSSGIVLGGMRTEASVAHARSIGRRLHAAAEGAGRSVPHLVGMDAAKRFESFPTPQEVAAVLYGLCTNVSLITGATIALDGGVSAGLSASLYSEALIASFTDEG